MDKVQQIISKIKKRAEFMRSVCKHSEANELVGLLSFIRHLPEEPVCEELEDEIERFLKNRCDAFSEEDKICECARHFADWQKEKITKCSWINASEVLPENDDIVLCAVLDASRESFQYYVGWYNDVSEMWWLADYGWVHYVSFWKPIEAPKVGDLLKEFE